MNKIYDPFNLLHDKKSYKVEPPGTLTYKGNYGDVKPSIECIEYDNSETKSSKVEVIGDKVTDDKVYWYNVVGLSNVEMIQQIGKSFDIHNMDLEDIVHVSQWSKIEVKENYNFSVLKMIYLSNQKIIHEHLAIYHKGNMIITFQETPGDVFENVRDRLIRNQGSIRNKAGEYLFYSLLDALVDQYFIVINKISSDFIDIEMKILEGDKRSKEKVHELRKELLYLINSVTPMKDSVTSLIENGRIIIDEDLEPYYGDLDEHLNQISDSLKAYKEMTNSLQEMHATNVSNDMNKIMMTLTIFSAIFIPLSFLAGVFGMNFHYFPGLDIKAGIYIFMSVCVIIAGGMLLFFKSKKWY
ncbi:MAG TPA: magnesium/cobalt transporter CorA [Anaerovoracaceae bacterium]|nr:magnesium/cobalt transporter CorA [Anaerovoracaceae bacterium]